MTGTEHVVAAAPKKYRNRLSLSNRAGRVLWRMVWPVLGRWSPTPFHFWRRWLLRLFGAKIGRGVHIYPSAKVWAPWNLVMGERSCLASGVDCYSVDRITIGAYVTVSQGAFLCTATHDFRAAAFPLVTKPITVGARAWVAASAFVGPGVTIGEGAVVGAMSCVVKDVPEWTVWAGNPATMVSERTVK